MKPSDILARLGAMVAAISTDNVEWNAKQWRELSRQTNAFIGESWEQSKCEHDGLRFTVSDGYRCGICLKRVE